MVVFGNWERLVERCLAQDEYLKRRFHDGRSWYDIISQTMDQPRLLEDWDVDWNVYL